MICVVRFNVKLCLENWEKKIENSGREKGRVEEEKSGGGVWNWGAVCVGHTMVLPFVV